jgi:hypothetical protein
VSLGGSLACNVDVVDIDVSVVVPWLETTSRLTSR